MPGAATLHPSSDGRCYHLPCFRDCPLRQFSCPPALGLAMTRRGAGPKALSKWERAWSAALSDLQIACISQGLLSSSLESLHSGQWPPPPSASRSLDSRGGTVGLFWLTSHWISQWFLERKAWGIRGRCVEPYLWVRPQSEDPPQRALSLPTACLCGRHPGCWRLHLPGAHSVMVGVLLFALVTGMPVRRVLL